MTRAFVFYCKAYRIAGLLLAMSVILVIASPAGGGSGAISSGNHRPDDIRSAAALEEIKLLEHECFDEVNKYREYKRLPVLDLDKELVLVARDYSRRMAEERFFSHTDSNGESVRERLAQAGIRWRSVGENIASSRGYINPVAAAVHGWLGSPGHRRNIVEPGFRFAAVGAWIGRDGTVFFTQVFIGR